MAINIIDFIPYGQENGVTYEELMLITGWSDRQVRAALHEAKCIEKICNIQDGSGFFKPIECKEDTVALYYMRQLKHRINELQATLRPFEDYFYLKGIE